MDMFTVKDTIISVQGFGEEKLKSSSPVRLYLKNRKFIEMMMISIAQNN